MSLPTETAFPRGLTIDASLLLSSRGDVSGRLYSSWHQRQRRACLVPRRVGWLFKPQSNRWFRSELHSNRKAASRRSGLKFALEHVATRMMCTVVTLFAAIHRPTYTPSADSAVPDRTRKSGLSPGEREARSIAILLLRERTVGGDLRCFRWPSSAARCSYLSASLSHRQLASG